MRDVVIPLAPLTVLVGANGAGKSSLLEALGYTTHEHGATGRQDDTRAEVSWYVAPVDRSDLATALRDASIGEDDEVARAVRVLDAHLVIHRASDGQSGLALDLFELLGDLPHRARHRRAEGVIGELTKIAASSWATTLVQLLRGHLDDLPPFVDLGVALTGRVEVAEPERISMVASPDDLSPVLLRWVDAIARSAYRPLAARDRDVERAFDALASGQLGPLQAVGVLEPVLRLLEHEIEARLPAFVRRRGVPLLECLDGPDTSVGAAMAIIDDVRGRLDDGALRAQLVEARQMLADSGDTVDRHLDSVFIEAGGPEGVAAARYPYSRLGTGARRWVCGALDEAGRRLVAAFEAAPLGAEEAELSVRAGRLERPAPVETPVCVRLVDEPIGSLEPRVHPEVMWWLSQHISDSESLVLSSHHASVLDASRPEELEVVGVYRAAGGVKVVPLGPGLLESLRRHLADIGLSRAELMFGVRALLLVEGVDDVALIKALYGEELAQRNVLVHPIGGSDHRAIVGALRDTAYELLALPTWVMLDDQPDDRLDEQWRWVRPVDAPQIDGPTELDRAVAQLGGASLGMLPLEAVDIAFAVHPKAYRTAAKRATFPITDEMRRPADTDVFADWRRTTRSRAAKEWVERALGTGAATFSSVIVPAVVAAIEASGNPKQFRTPWLDSTMERFFIDLDGLSNPDVFERPVP